MKRYKVSEEYVKAVKNFILSKTLINKVDTEMSEQELNDVLAYLGQFPYNEVSEFFTKGGSHITEIKEETEKECNCAENGCKCEEKDEVAS